METTSPEDIDLNPTPLDTPSVSEEIDTPEMPADPQQLNNSPSETINDTALAEMLAEAEMRGYLKGRNENIANLMAHDPAWRHESAPDDAATSPVDEPEILILNHRRHSVWD